MAQLLQLFQGNCVFFIERAGSGAAQLGNVPMGSQNSRQIAREGPHIGAFAAHDLENGRIRVRLSHEIEPVDTRDTWGKVEFFAIASEIVRSRSVDLDG